MVEIEGHCVVQWTGHAAHVTERFAGLFARQALVDVTLICQGQKLRLHKLVLASCSLYFEEMLEQDLGQEPIILLRDLDFDVLKAMVEFMYCGETTISQCHLQTLLDAAQVFKVKELESIVKSMLATSKGPNDETSDPEDEIIIGNSSDTRKIGENSMRESTDSYNDSSTSSSTSDLEDDAISECNDDQTIVEATTKNCYNETNDDHSLYDSTILVPMEIPSNNSQNDRQFTKNIYEKTLNDIIMKKFEISGKNENDEISTNIETSMSINEKNDSTSTIIEHPSELSKNTTTSMTKILTNEQNIINDNFDNPDCRSIVGECSKVYSHKKRKYPDSDDLIGENSNDTTTESSSIDENPIDDRRVISSDRKKIDKCLKVYTHKRRKSKDEKKSSSMDLRMNNGENKSINTSCIDLAKDDEICDQPITLSGNLDMETSEYVWSMSSESIQYVVGCTINQCATLNPHKDSNTIDEPSKTNLQTEKNNVDDVKSSKNHEQLFSMENSSSNVGTVPVLRRSVRINQLENDDNVDNNGNTTNNLTTTKTREKDNLDVKNVYYTCNNHPTTGRTNKRRGNKDADFRIADENNLTTNSPNQKSCLRKNVNNSRSLRSTTKLQTGRNNTVKTRCGYPKNHKYEQKTKNNVRMKKIDNTDCEVLLPMRLNTIASVDRALWGDMSDVLENQDFVNSRITVEQSSSKEIPFALGLLPLRAALERMQATLDHQPRKTRSSVAPLRQDVNGTRRKDTMENIVGMKKMGVNDNHGVDDSSSGNTVCHIEIRTSSELEDNRRDTRNEEEIIAVGSSSVNNRR